MDVSIKLDFSLLNKVRITAIAFLAYFIMSGMLAPVGIISGPMSESLGLPITEVTASFSMLTVGLMGGALFALIVFEYAALKAILFCTYSAIALSLLSLNILEIGPWAWWAIGIVGFGCGVGLASGALIITKTYETSIRAAMLVVTDSCFSLAGIICSSLAVFFVAREFAWSATYQVVAIAALIIVPLTVFSRFPQTMPQTLDVAGDASSASNEREGPWPAGVWLCIGSLFLYTLGQSMFMLWLPNYAETMLDIERATAGQLIGWFWLGMFIGQLIVVSTVMKVGVLRFVRILALTTVGFSIPLWICKEPDVLLMLALVWGVANLSLLKVVISFATQFVKNPGGRLISALLVASTSGTSLSAWVSSRIVEVSSSHVVLQFGSACFLVMALLLMLATTLQTSSTQDIN